MFRFSTFVPVLLALLLGACGAQPRGLDPGVKVLEYSELPPPTRADQLAAPRAYYVGPFDKLKIQVFGVEDIEREVQLDAGGQFSFPFLGTINASGQTPEELQLTLQRGLSRYIRDPQVSVNLTSAVSQAVTVEGEVKEPGIYPVTGNMSLIRTVATAGGVSEMASLDDVVVFRKIEGQRYAALYNLRAIRRGNYADPEIYANDVVVVGDSSSRRLFRDIVAALPLLTTPIIMLATE